MTDEAKTSLFESRLEDKEIGRKMNQDMKEMYKDYSEEYYILGQCKYMLHTVQYKKGIMLDPCTNLAVQGQHDNDTGSFLTTEEMIVSYHYYVSISKQKRKEENFYKIFFELNKLS